ncbi:hypothetical protein [Kitasatospora cheerisanensis]|uniref:Uncharacterized protein n=1 Tax=Kitasatospora cheerisanensis KCTC 2395 TaxID=1348663 RepID=A0A066Z5W9_9ACTN|nr:hypothetical protein [Kitasatospora cheerisanensis]KDN85696.1 hypothetical protein KCH_25240 [Kitasatospora cheerisanensis KCTC 2395]
MFLFDLTADTPQDLAVEMGRIPVHHLPGVAVQIARHTACPDCVRNASRFIEDAITAAWLSQAAELTLGQYRDVIVNAYYVSLFRLALHSDSSIDHLIAAAHVIQRAYAKHPYLADR